MLDDSDQANALGYHDLTSEGLPIGKAFAASDLKAGTSWTVTARHELLERLGDPNINLTVFVQNSNSAGILYAYEVCAPAKMIALAIRSTTFSCPTLSIPPGLKASAPRVRRSSIA